MIIRRAWLLMVCVVALASCATPVKPQMADTDTLLPEQGVMVARIAMPYLGMRNHQQTTIFVQNTFSNTYMPLANYNNAAEARELLQSGIPIALHNSEEFVVIPLPPGTYSWSGLQIGAYSSYWGATKKFNIAAGKINYVGDITLVMNTTSDSRTFNVNFRSYDYHDVFLPRIAATYPKLWSSYPVIVSLTHGPR